MENRKIINSVHVGFSVKNSVDVGFMTRINRLSTRVDLIAKEKNSFEDCYESILFVKFLNHFYSEVIARKFRIKDHVK